MKMLLLLFTCLFATIVSFGEVPIPDGAVELRQAAEQGDAKSQHNLGLMYNDIKDDVEAMKWYRKAAEQGYAPSQYNLGLEYHYGLVDGIAKDDVEAAKWYHLAAEQGLPEAQFFLGLMYGNGEGVTKDAAEESKWHHKAAEQGDRRAQYALGVMYANGRFVAEDDVEAIKWYRKAAEQGLAKAQHSIDKMHANGEGVVEADAAEVSMRRKAAETGDAKSQHDLGVMYDHGRGVTEDNAEALKWYRKAAEQEFGASQLALGLMYADGQGVTKDDVEAVKWYRKAAEQGLAKAQYNLGMMYANGRGVNEDDVEAVKWYGKSVDQGDIDAMVALAEMHGNGDGVPQDSGMAYSWYLLAAGMGHAEAQYVLGVMNDHGRVIAEDDVEAAKWYRMAAEQGHAHAQYRLGEMHEDGAGVAKDDVEAVKWYRQAAEQGDAEAQLALGIMYSFSAGVAVAEDNVKAVKWYRMAAEQGYAKGQLALGMMYADGRGVDEDSVEAGKWYRMAAEQGNRSAQYKLEEMNATAEGDVNTLRKAAEDGDAKAQYALGKMYAHGRGVAEDDVEAAKWYRMAAEQGHAHAQFISGLMYANTDPPDDVRAHMWATLADSNGQGGARGFRERLSIKMTVEQLAESQEMVRAWGAASIPVKAFDTFTINGNEIVVPTPDGFARVTDEMTSVMKLMRAHHSADPFNDALAFYIAESEVALALAGKLPPLDRTLSLKVNKELREMTVSGGVFSQFKEVTRSSNKEMFERIQSELPKYTKAINDAMGQAFDIESALAISQMIPLEPHYETEDSIAFSMYLNYATAGISGDDKIAMSATSTFLNASGSVLFLYAYAPKEDLEWTRSASSDWAEAVLAGNSQSPAKSSEGSLAKLEAGRGFDSSYMQEAVVGALVTGLLLVVIGVFLSIFIKKKAVKGKATPVSPPQLKKVKSQKEESAAIPERIPIDSKSDIQQVTDKPKENCLNEKDAYICAAQEVDSSTQDPALWIKAMTLAKGDQEKARYEYISLRVDELV
jgi:TPR repeat protein